MLQIKNVCKEYKTGNLIQKALDNVSLNLRDNEFVAILGPSGSGKTTLLNIIGGLDHYDTGDLIINGVSTKKYKDRDWDSYRNHTVGFVFQSYNLIPHQTILSNVELALTISGVSRNKRRQMALKALEQVGLKEQAHKKPNQLSGGQMQRVAIARALVNNPYIILADEPTGALDSETSVQVMDLLKEVAKDRLVVMVTHNPELAKKYATRIVNLRDGKICSDSCPYEIDSKENKTAKHKNMGKTSMSFLTALSLSFNNLKTKKGRTFLTSFAGSIGIIGIALILSLSNGVNTYIKSVEEDTLSEYPLQIQSTGIDMTSLITGATENAKESSNQKAKESGKQSEEINVNKTLSGIFSTIGTNDLVSLKKYLESDKSHIYDYAKAVEYVYNISPIIYNSDTEKLRQLNPNTTLKSLGMGSEENTNSLISGIMDTDVFFQMPANADLYRNQYDVKAGRWADNYNECVLVLTSAGSISDFLLYTLGLRDFNELDDMIKSFTNEENIQTPTDFGKYSYDDILGKTFKLVNSSDCYEYDEEYKIWKDKTDNTEYMKNIVEKGEDIKIVGIVKPKEGISGSMLSPGINYPYSLTQHIIENSANSKIVKDQIEQPEINVFTGKRFDDTENNNNFDMNSLIEVDENALKSAFKIDQSKIKIDFSNLNNIVSQNSLPELDLNEILDEIEFSIPQESIQKIINDIIKGYEEYLKNNPDASFNQLNNILNEYLQSKEAGELINNKIEKIIKENKSITITQEQMQEIMQDVLNNFQEYAKEKGFENVTEISKYLMEYLESEDAKKIIANDMSEIIKSQNLDEQISKIIEKYMKSAMSTMSKSLEKEMKSSINKLSKSITNAISIDTNAFSKAFRMKMNQEELYELFSSMMSNNNESYDNNLRKLNYADLNKPFSINIYSRDFEGNKKITNLLDSYNNKMREDGEDKKVISYTDMVGTMMSSVTNIVNTVSYVLIAFTGISLIVSSIMIGVITYISVLERRKEIGILRAIGASKHNISQVFNAETFIIGTLSGLMGIGITLLLIIPINRIISVITEGVNVKAILPVKAGIMLILLSIILTLIGGILPSRKAAKEDPVLALKSE